MPARIFASAARLRLMLLAAQVDRGPTIIRYVEGARMMTVEAPPGLVLPLLTSSTGHVFMAWQPRSIWESLVRAEADAASGSKRIPGNPEQIVRKVLRQGIATVDGTASPRICAMSVPVFTYSRQLACVLTTLGWRGELDIDPRGNTAVNLKQVGSGVSRQLGHSSQSASRP